MKRKPDQLQSKLTGSSSNTTFNMTLNRRECNPDNNQTSKQMTLYTKFSFKFATLPIFHQKKKTKLNTALIQQNR